MLKYLFCISLFLIYSKSLLEYGEFDIAITNFEMCNGPKRKNCVEITAEIINNTTLKYDFLVKEDMKAVKGKIIGSVNDKELLRVQVKNICDHIFLGPLVQTLLNGNGTDRCGIFKGHYLINADIQTISRNFYGGKFIYGNWKFRLLFYSDNCNMHCANIYLSMNPKRTISHHQTSAINNK